MYEYKAVSYPGFTILFRALFFMTFSQNLLMSLFKVERLGDGINGNLEQCPRANAFNSVGSGI